MKLKKTINNNRISFFLNGRRITNREADFYMSTGRASTVVIETKVPEYGLHKIETINLVPEHFTAN